MHILPRDVWDSKKVDGTCVEDSNEVTVLLD